MIKKIFVKYGLLIPLAFLGIACTSDSSPNYSSNLDTTLNITGNYYVMRIPDHSITNFTLTQTGSLVQGVDNKGTRYEGSSTGDIQTLSVEQINAGKQQTYLTTAITIQGTDGAGKVITIILTQVNWAMSTTSLSESSVVDTGLEVHEMPSQQTNLSNQVAIAGLAGTYTDSTGASGTIELFSNVVL